MDSLLDLRILGTRCIPHICSAASPLRLLCLLHRPLTVPPNGSEIRAQHRAACTCARSYCRFPLMWPIRFRTNHVHGPNSRPAPPPASDVPNMCTRPIENGIATSVISLNSTSEMSDTLGSYRRFTELYCSLGRKGAGASETRTGALRWDAPHVRHRLLSWQWLARAVVVRV